MRVSINDQKDIMIFDSEFVPISLVFEIIENMLQLDKVQKVCLSK